MSQQNAYDKGSDVNAYAKGSDVNAYAKGSDVNVNIDDVKQEQESKQVTLSTLAIDSKLKSTQIFYTSDVTDKVANEFFTKNFGNNEVRLDFFINELITHHKALQGSLSSTDETMIRHIAGMFICGITIKDHNKSLDTIIVRAVDLSGFLHKFGKTDSVDLIVNAFDTCQKHFFDDNDHLYKWWFADGIKIIVDGAERQDGLLKNQKGMLRYISTIDTQTAANLPKINMFTMLYINIKGSRKIRIIFEGGVFYTFNVCGTDLSFIAEIKYSLNKFLVEKCGSYVVINPHGYVNNVVVAVNLLTGDEESYIALDRKKNPNYYEIDHYKNKEGDSYLL